ncbi:Troponin T [Hirschfeldia incana]|nr:Troponin T [Hirschfeldia incana]
MGGCTSKQERPSLRSVKKETSTERSRGRRHLRRETDVREKVIFEKLREAEREWAKERKKLREQVKRLRKKVEEREEAKTTTTEEREYWKWVVEEMCVERAVRDEAVEKWKQLYLTIKNELDHLIIHTTSSSSGEAIMQRQIEGKYEEEAVKTVEELRDDVRVKENTIEKLKEKITLMDREKYEKEREIDLLRQSLRILGSKTNKKKGASFASMNLMILKTKCVECT